MQEHRVTAGGHTYDIDESFFVLATQNPIEQEGTYPSRSSIRSFYVPPKYQLPFY